MKYLYLDTTNGLTIGLLNEKFEWIVFESSDEKKPSEVIHKKIDEISKQFNVDMTQSTLITIAGPGSYTGMRLSEGLANILKICGTKVVSLLHFEIPLLTGVQSGVWITNAFKNQFFVYEWNGNENRNFLIDANDMNFSKEIFSNMQLPLFKNIQFTTELIKENPQPIFNFAVNRGQFLGAYYFRTLDEEFKTIC